MSCEHLEDDAGNQLCLTNQSKICAVWFRSQIGLDDFILPSTESPEIKF